MLTNHDIERLSSVLASKNDLKEISDDIVGLKSELIQIIESIENQVIPKWVDL